MKNIYRIDLNKIRQESLNEVFVLLESHLSKFGINFYLIGAVAKDMWMSGVYDVALGRVTADLDLAVLVEDEGQYEALKEDLVKTGRFWALKGNKYAMLFDDKIQIDLLPFGGLNIGDLDLSHVIALTNITNGFEEVHKNGTAQIEIQGQQFAVSTLPAIVLLKLIAYDDRPENRGKDLNDIGNIVQHYLYIAGEDVFEEEFIDLVDLDNTLAASAQLVGRHIYLIIKYSLVLVERVMLILDKYHFYMEYMKDDSKTEIHTDILKEIRTGIATSMNNQL